MKFLSQVTPEELKLVPHHLINILDPLQTNTVVDFRHRALPEVERLLREGKIPFICGGTNYYIESLLWRILVDQELPILGSRKRVNTEGEETSEGATERKVSTENTLHNSSVESAPTVHPLDTGRNALSKHFSLQTPTQLNWMRWDSNL